MKRNMQHSALLSPSYKKFFLEIVRRMLLETSLFSSRHPDVLKLDLWNEVGDKEKDFTNHINDIFEPNSMTYIELDKDLCEKYRRLGTGNRVANSSISSMKLPYDKFDILLDISTSDHLEDEKFEKAIKEYHRVLKTGGILVMLHDNAEFLTFSMFKEDIPEFGFFPRSVAHIRKSLESNGFEILKMRMAFSVFMIYMPNIILKMFTSIPVKRFISKVEYRIGNSILSRSIIVIAQKKQC